MAGAGVFASPLHQDRLWEPPSLLPKGYRGYFSAIKATGREADH